jgi:DNA-binding response OmpR family regulator
MDSENGKRRILIVDDETELSLLFKANLEIRGYVVETCDNGESALQVAREFRPDLILLDLMMPRLSGFDAIDLFHNTVETSASYIVIFSALSQPDDIARAKSLGVDDYIVKSNSTLEEVIERIEKILQPDAAPGSPTPAT